MCEEKAIFCGVSLCTGNRWILLSVGFSWVFFLAKKKFKVTVQSVLDRFVCVLFYDEQVGEKTTVGKIHIFLIENVCYN